MRQLSGVDSEGIGQEAKQVLSWDKCRLLTKEDAHKKALVKTAWAQSTRHGGTDQPWNHVVVLWCRARPGRTKNQDLQKQN